MEASCSSALTEAPVNMPAVKGKGATPTTQTGGAEAAIWPGWLVQIEDQPKVRGKAAVLKVKVIQSHQHWTKETHLHHPTVACLAAISCQQIVK